LQIGPQARNTPVDIPSERKSNVAPNQSAAPVQRPGDS
jgi:hypothetical protein